MFIRNCWYVVAWDHEIPADGLFARTVIGEPLVLYRPLYNASGDWVRPYAMFFEDVVIDGVKQPRFTRVP